MFLAPTIDFQILPRHLLGMIYIPFVISIISCIWGYTVWESGKMTRPVFGVVGSCFVLSTVSWLIISTSIYNKDDYKRHSKALERGVDVNAKQDKKKA